MSCRNAFPLYSEELLRRLHIRIAYDHGTPMIDVDETKLVAFAVDFNQGKFNESPLPRAILRPRWWQVWRRG